MWSSCQHHKIANFPFILQEDHFPGVGVTRRMNQSIMQFKPHSELRYMEWLRRVKPDEYRRKLEAL